MRSLGLLLSAALALCLGATLVTGGAACNPAQEAAVVADLPGIEAATGASCAIIEGSTVATPEGVLVDVACAVATGGEQLAGAILSAAGKGATAVTTTSTTDAGALPSVVVHGVPQAIAVAIVASCPRAADAGPG